MMILRLNCTGDSTATLSYPDGNSGKYYRLTVGNGINNIIFVRYDTPPDMYSYDIISATLYFYVTESANAVRIWFYKVLDDWKEGNGPQPWSTDENGVTYNNMPSISSNYIEHYISTTPSGGQWRSVSVTNNFKEFATYGWAAHIRPGDTNYAFISSREGSYPSYLEVTYKLKSPILTLQTERLVDGFKLTWNKQAINYYQPVSYRVFKYNPVVNEYVFVTTLDGNTFEYMDYELFDYDYEYKYCIDARYNDDGTWKYTNPVFVVGGTLYKSDVPQVELAAVGGQSAMRHLINTTHSESFDELNNIEISTWKKNLDATSVSRDVDLRLTGDGNTFIKNILPIDDSHLGYVDQRWLEIHAEELKTDTSKTAKLRLWNGR